MQKLAVLIVEDNESDAILNVRQIYKSGYEVTYERVETASEFKTMLQKHSWDVILADYNLPRFDAPSALTILKESGLDIPFIIISGAVGEDTAVEMMRAGAHDYFMKDRLTRLVSAIEREIRDAASRKEKKKSELQFRNVFEGANDAILILSKDQFIECNQKAVHLYGVFSKEDLLFASPWNFSPKVQPNGKDSRQAAKKHIKLALTGQPQRFYWKHMTKAGQEIHCDVSLSRIELEGGAVIQAIVRDITDRIRIEDSLRESKDQLKVFAAHLQTVREDERIQIARELHDNLGQNLTGIRMEISRIVKKLREIEQPCKVEGVLDQAIDMLPLIDSTIEQVRKISSELRPRVLDELGLVSAIEWQIDQFKKRSYIDCQFHSEINLFRMEKPHLTGIFRIFQETLTNIMRHANATKVSVRIRKQNGSSAILEVEDNGIGLDKRKIAHTKSLGILGMRERAVLFGGEITIQSKRGKGTKVILHIPNYNNPDITE